MLIHKQLARKKIPKRFEEKWVTHPKCKGIILEAWNGEISMGSQMYRLFEKIKKRCMALVGWSRQLGCLKTKIEEKKSDLETLIAMNSADNLDVIQRVKDEINALLLQEELFWRQRFRSIWLPAGDKNTKYRYISAKDNEKTQNLLRIKKIIIIIKKKNG